MKLMVIPVGRSLVFELQLSQILRPILKRFGGRLARYANIDILKTSSAEEENILGILALSPPAEEEHILASVLTRVPEKGKTPPKIDPSLV